MPHPRTTFITLASALFLAAAAAPLQMPWPTEGWPTATPESQGFQAGSIDTFDREIRGGTYGNVDRLFITRHARSVADLRYTHDYRAIGRGRSSALGCGEGCTDSSGMTGDFNYYDASRHPYYEGRDVHTLQSITKSIAATVVGIAIYRGAIAGVDQPLLSFFSDRDLSGIDPRLRRATLADLLTMRSGIEWHEGDRPLDDTNTTVQLERSQDWIAFTLAQPMDADPGTKWAYNSGGSHLMSGIIRAATGRFIDDYAREHLFTPLGIGDFHWKRTPKGYPDTEGGLYLAAEDLAKIGYLYLRGGVWNGVRILPEGWTEAATTRHARSVGGGWDYGYQWWVTSRNGLDVWAGRGFGGQLLLIVPARDIVAVVNAWNIFDQRVPNILGPVLDLLTSMK
ncbi:MAG TPA: serine hydrolase [Vicinamibacterales bacterium]|nr:serine hydrolase [Vicinamibacterales bacterium]